MTFQETENRYKSLKNQLNAHRITPQQFATQVSELRIQDEQGRWWQIHAEQGNWVTWNGKAWVAAAPPVKARPPVSQAAGAPPTLMQLLRMVLKNIFKKSLLRIPLAIGMALLTMIVHTFLLVGPNGGFGAGVNPILDSILALQGKIVSGTLFWALLAGLTTAIFARLRQVGITGTVRGIQMAPTWVKNSLRAGGFSGPGILLIGAALTLWMGTSIGNRLVSLQLTIAAIGALIAQHESFSYLVISAAWGDSQRILKRTASRFNPAWAGVLITGAVLGFGGATILPFPRFLGCAGGVILTGIALALILMQKNKPGIGATLLILGILLSATLMVTPVFADDGGWDEAGGSLSSWMSSQGAVVAVAHGVPPSVGAAVGVLVGGSLAGLSGAAAGGVPGSVPVPVPQPQVPFMPPMQPQQPYPVDAPEIPLDDGWPKPGERNDQGQVWYHPPWDQGGAYWVDKAEFDDIQEHLSNGDQWSDHWGWKPPEEINQLDKEREDRWEKFTNPDERQKQHDQMMKRIEQDIANDPHHQKIMQELDQIKKRLDDMKRQGLQDDIDYYSKLSAQYTKKAEFYDKLHKGASVVKSGADLAIDTLGMAPGGGRIVKYSYKFISNTAQTSIETGSISQGLTKGVVETGKAYVGDKIGDNLPVPGIDDPTVWANVPVKDFVKKVTTSPYDASQLVLNKLKDSTVSDGVNRFENGVHSIVDNPQE